MPGALHNVKVLDITHVLAGPFCTYQLGLLGAEVVKIEPVDAPDCARGRGPDADGNAAGLGLTYQVQGGNKKALALDLSTPTGREVLLRLVSESDVIVENYTTGAMDRLGLGHSVLAQANPRLVHCSITGFGDTGPRARTRAYDNVIQATSGTIGQCDGRKPGVSFVDYSTGYAAAFAIAAALVQRDQTGKGCQISVSMLEVAMQMMAPEVAAVQAAEHRPASAKRSKEPGIATYDTADGPLMLGAFRPAQYEKLGQVLARHGHPVPALSQLCEWPDVWALGDEVRGALQQAFLSKTAEEWVEILHAADLPAERVKTLKEAVQNEQLAARGYFVANPADPNATLPLTGFRMSTGGPELTTAPPAHGADTDAILHELGYDDTSIAASRRDKTIL